MRSSPSHNVLCAPSPETVKERKLTTSLTEKWVKRECKSIHHQELPTLDLILTSPPANNRKTFISPSNKVRMWTL
jgi:hypothetical protein